MVFSCLLRLDLKLLYNCSQRDMVTLAAYRNEIKQWTRFHPFDRLHPFCQWWDIFLSVIQSIKEAVEQYSEKRPNSRRTKVSSFATKDDGKVRVQEKSPDCIYCSEDHILDRCNAFMNQTLKESIKFLSRKKICYGCLKPMEDGHNANSCKKRLSCKTCKERHPTPLHCHWRIKLFYVQKCQIEINQFKVFDGQ